MTAEAVLVVGAGVMGVGIIHAFALSGASVAAVELDGERRSKAQAEFRSVLNGGVERGKLEATAAADAFARVTWHRSIDAAPAGEYFSIEVVPEQPSLKSSILRDLEARGPNLLASNTSAISIDLLAEGLEHPERFVGMHFFNPVWAMLLVEVVLGTRTSVETRAMAVATVERIVKRPIVVRDSPGFASSRLGIALGLEAIRMIESGVSSVVDIDAAMTLGYRHPVGPLLLTDQVGLDVRLDIARYLASTLGPRFEPPQLLVDMVADGQLGRKVGRGFYSWVDGKPVAAKEVRDG